MRLETSVEGLSGRKPPAVVRSWQRDQPGPRIFNHLPLASFLHFQVCQQEETEMKKAVLAMILLGSSVFAGPRFAAGFYFGAPAPVVAVRPVCAGPGYVWIDGYRAPNGVWVAGYWGLPPYAGAYWVGPRYYGPRFAPGYWARGYDRDRDFRHERFGYRR